MSKLYNKYLELKKKDSSKILLFKSGMFYIFLDEDSKRISEILHLKQTYLNGEIVKCGFPINSLTKYCKLLDAYNIPYEIIDNQVVNSKKDYIEDQEIQNYLKQIEKIDINKTTPIKCMEIVAHLKKLLTSSANT